MYTQRKSLFLWQRLSRELSCEEIRHYILADIVSEQVAIEGIHYRVFKELRKNG